jgi:hypothetical protein
MRTPNRVGRSFTLPVTRGQITWYAEPWGARVVETIYDSVGKQSQYQVETMRLPWDVLEVILETRPGVHSD